MYKIFLNKITQLLTYLVGHWHWQPPPWIQKIPSFFQTLLNKRKEAPRLFYGGIIAFIVIAVLSVFGYRGYENWLKSANTVVTITPPALMPLTANALPNKLTITFSRSVAPLAAIHREIKEGIALSPPLTGTWRFESDRELVFTPEAHPLTPLNLQNGWIPGFTYRVDFTPSLFIEKAGLKSLHYEFKTPDFQVRLPKAVFYQDPKDPNLKKIITEFEFSHPIDKSDFEKRLGLSLLKPRKYAQDIERTLRFSVVYDPYGGKAAVHSEPLAIPEKDQEVLITLNEDSRSIFEGGNRFKKRLEARATVPSKYTGLQVTNAQSTFAQNDQEQNERVLVVESTTPLTIGAMATHVKVWQLPLNKPALFGRPEEPHYAWNNPAEIGPEILARATVLPLIPLPTEQEVTTLHSFTYAAEKDRYIFVRIERGLLSVGGYELAKSFETTLLQEPFPPEIHIQYEGSLLSLTGDRTLSIMTRDVQAVQFEVGRVLPNKVHHLIQMTSGRFDKPQFEHSSLSPDSLTERFTRIETISSVTGSPTFLTFSFSEAEHLPHQGLFFFKVQGWDSERLEPTDPKDERFILITDLGLLVKDNADGSHDVFVLSLKTGRPEENAEVSVLGQNGLPLLVQATDETGHVQFPSLNDFGREKKPVAYIVQKDQDFSFLPYDRGDRRLHFSRFDVEGDYTSVDPKALEAYVFADRDLYRPGETAHSGMIVKPREWGRNLEGAPLEVVLTDPRGMEIHKHLLQLHASGFNTFDYSFLPNALTGIYSLSLHLQGDKERNLLLGSHELRVEEFAPDRLKIEAQFSKDKLDGWVTPDALMAHVTLATLFGAPAGKHTITTRLEISRASPEFKTFKEYHFFDPMRIKKQFSEKFPTIQTDSYGHATVDLNLSRFTESSFKLDLFFQGFEGEGGRSVNTMLSTFVSPLPYFVGYKSDAKLQYLAKNSRPSVHLIAIDPAVRSVSTKNLVAKVLEIEYVSVLKKQPNGTFAYESIARETQIKQENITIPEGGFEIALATENPGDFALVIQNEMGVILNKIAYTVVGKSNLTNRLEKSAELKLSLNKDPNKERYLPGEFIELQIKAPYHGSGLITIERDKVYAYQWFNAKTNTTLQRIQIPAELEGNAYVNVSFVRALNSPEIYTSPLSYAVMPFFVDSEARVNNIKLSFPEVIHPGDAIPIRYQTEFPGQLLIFAVDEGILSAAHYETPDPLGFFFRKRALQVETAQILDLLLPEYHVSKSLFAAGGGTGEETEMFLNPFKRKGKQPVVFWSGLLEASDTPQEIAWKVPDYFNGSVRFMAVAVSAERMGAFSLSKTIKSDLVITPHIPLFVAPGDEFSVQATIYRTPPPYPLPQGEGGLVRGSGGNNIPVSLEPSSSFTVLGSATEMIQVPEGGNGNVKFLVRANSKLGSGTLTFKATLGGKRAQLQEEISVRPPTLFSTHLTVGAVKASERRISVSRTLFPEKSVKTIGVSSVPISLSHGLISYLEGYPYGCTEQLVSQAFPLILLEQKMKLPTSYLQHNFYNKTISILRARQNEQGAFGYWAANAAADPFASVYATHFLIESQEHGYPVPRELLQNALDYLQLVAEQDEVNTDYGTWAYAIYLLTRQGIVSSDALNALYQAFSAEPKAILENSLTPLYAAAAYKLLKQDELAERLMSKAYLSSERLAKWQEGEFLLDDPLVYMAGATYLTAKHFPSRVPSMQGEYFLRLADRVNEQRYHSLSAAYLVLAFDAISELQNAPTAGTFSVIETQTNQSKRVLGLTGDVFFASPLSNRAKTLTVQNKGPQYLFYELTESGFDLQPPLKAIKENIEILREYRDEQGRLVEEPSVGQKLTAVIKLRALSPTCACDHVAVVDILPGGLEVDIAAARSQFNVARNNDAPLGQWVPDHMDIREDRVMFFGNLDTNAKEFSYPVYAAYPGTFALPPITAESMYHRHERALSPGGKITVENRQ